jgi:hypothetical protein
MRVLPTLTIGDLPQHAHVLRGKDIKIKKPAFAYIYFKDEHSKNRALHPTMQIFGVTILVMLLSSSPLLPFSVDSLDIYD